MKAFRAAVKARDKAATQTHIDATIALFGDLNGKLTAKAAAFDEFIATLS